MTQERPATPAEEEPQVDTGEAPKNEPVDDETVDEGDGE